MLGGLVLPAVAVVIATAGYLTSRSLGRTANRLADTSNRLADTANRAGAMQLVRLYDDRMNAPRLLAARSAIGTAVLAGIPAPEGYRWEPLNLFEEIALACREQALSLSIVLNSFGDLIVHYWYALQPEIEAYRAGDRGVFENVEWLVGRISDEYAEGGIADTQVWSAGERQLIFESERDIEMAESRPPTAPVRKTAAKKAPQKKAIAKKSNS